MAQSAAAAISKGCQMLSEGKAEIDKFKKQVEGGVANAKAIYNEVTGIWGWLTGLFGPPKAVTKVQVPAESIVKKQEPKKSKKEPEPELSYEEYQARQVHEICENLKVYFEAMRQLKAHCEELEQQALTTDRVADSAIDRIEIEWQMAQLSNQVSQAMIYQTPQALGLGDLYKNFLRTYNQILEEQEYDRMLKRKNERDARWQREQIRYLQVDLLVAAVATLIVNYVLWSVLSSISTKLY
jgi:hypothetical protein